MREDTYQSAAQSAAQSAVRSPVRQVLAAAASGVSEFIARCGGRPAAVLSGAGVADHDLGNPRAGLDLGRYCAMMELAARETGNDRFGLDFGQQFQPERLGLIGDISLSAPTLGAALEALAGLFPLHQQVTETRFVRDGGLYRLEYRILDGRIIERRQDAELTLGMFANVLRRCLGARWTPEEVHFEHPRAADSLAHEEAFGADVHFGQRTNALVFRDPGLARPMPGGDLRRMDRLKEDLWRVAGGTGQIGFADRVRGEVRSVLVEGYPHVEAIAEGLGLPRWTLQRRLAEMGLSFSDLVEDVRRDLAVRYVAQPHVPITDIADLLGYSEVSAFSRAFRRWFGVSPAAARLQRQDGWELHRND